MASADRVLCPGCGGEIILKASPPPDSAGAESIGPGLTPAQIAAGFGAMSARRRTSLTYHLGLLLVTVGMICLPIIYLALVFTVAWATWWWAVHSVVLVSSLTGGLWIFFVRVALYLAPMFAGALTALFMIKPLFSRPPRPAQPLALNPGAEPALFAFIENVCRAVGAPRPKRIDLDCRLNASAGFRRGTLSFLGHDMVLTLGLPLVASLNLREFAGVLAHEFGHFKQGVAMRAGFLIYAINSWLARVVHERDSWDEWLGELADGEGTTLQLTVFFARLGVGFTRLLLSALMRTGLLMSGYMSREMEYDADECEIKVAGSEAFETLMAKLAISDAVLVPSLRAASLRWKQCRELPDNIPAYLLLTAASIPAATRQQIVDTMGLTRTKPSDTHPSKGDRIRRARQAAEPGILHLEGAASALFHDFAIAARQVTLVYYRDVARLPLHGARLKPIVPQSLFKNCAKIICNVNLYCFARTSTSWGCVIHMT